MEAVLGWYAPLIDDATELEIYIFAPFSMVQCVCLSSHAPEGKFPTATQDTS